MSLQVIPPRDSVLQAQLHPWLRTVLVLSGNIPAIFQQIHIDGSFPSFFADALRAAHHMLFPPRDLLFPKLFGTKSPEDVTGEKRPLFVTAFSAQHTCKDSFLHSFTPRLSGFALFGFGTCSQSLASAWECWGHRQCPSAQQQLYCLLCVT